MRKKQTFREQIQENSVAIISLVVAIAALGYTTWREEVTERNRNYRQASFEVLKNLGELQIIVNQAHFHPESEMGNPFNGWGRVSLVSDLSTLLPEPVPKEIEKLKETWNTDWEKIKTNRESAEKITQEIDNSREAVLDTIKKLK